MDHQHKGRSKSVNQHNPIVHWLNSSAPEGGAGVDHVPWPRRAGLLPPQPLQHLCGQAVWRWVGRVHAQVGRVCLIVLPATATSSRNSSFDR